MGGVITSLFGGQSSGVDIPQADPVILDDNEKEPVSAAVRDTEKRRLMARRAGNGTILSDPLGRARNQPSLLGQSLK